MPGHSRASSSGGCSSDGDLAAGDAACSSAVADGSRAAGQQQAPWDDRIGAIRGSACNSPARQATGVDSWPTGPVPGDLGAVKACDGPQVWQNTACAQRDEMTNCHVNPAAVYRCSGGCCCFFHDALDLGTARANLHACVLHRARRRPDAIDGALRELQSAGGRPCDGDASLGCLILFIACLKVLLPEQHRMHRLFGTEGCEVVASRLTCRDGGVAACMTSMTIELPTVWRCAQCATACTLLANLAIGLH